MVGVSGAQVKARHWRPLWPDKTERMRFKGPLECVGENKILTKPACFAEIPRYRFNSQNPPLMSPLTKRATDANAAG